MEEASLWLRELITPYDVYLHGASEVVLWRRTPYQEICIVETEAFGKKLFLDGIVQSSEADEFIYHEALVQPAMLAAGAPRRVLVLGGGEGACLREVLRWDTVSHAVMIDIDADVVAACRAHLPEWHQGSFHDPRVQLLHTDAVQYLERVTDPFDVIISDMTDPVEDGPSTFCFTREYFQRVQSALTDDGVFALQAGPLSPPEISLHAKVLRTMELVFSHVQPYPCNAAVYGRPLGFAVASRTPIHERLDPAITAPLLERHVRGPLRYIDAQVARGLMATPPFVREAIGAADAVYTDATPPRTAHAAGWEASE
jgi:spermidine synthase